MTIGMTIRRTVCAATLTAMGTLLPAIASAQIRQVSSQSDAKQTVNFTIGVFSPKPLDSRVTDDVLLNELQSDIPLSFQISDFRSALFGGEYLLGITRNLEAGVGLAYSQVTVPSFYLTKVHQNGDDITQDLKLRQVPVTFTVRYLPLGHRTSIEPYVGAGVVAIKWRYSETGEFLDDAQNIFSSRYVADGTAAGPTILGGVRAPIGNLAIGAEARWQKVEAKGLFNAGLPGDKLDLGGWVGNFTVGVRF